MEKLPITVDQVLYFFLVFVRTVTMLALIPIYGSSSVSIPLKIGFSLLLTLLLFPVLAYTPLPASSPLSMQLFVLLIVKEVMVGIAVGLVASLLFTAVQYAGRLVDTEMGFGFVELVDPFTEEMVTVWGQLQTILFTLLFLIFNGHYFLLLAVERSFELVPLLGAELPGERVAWHFTALTGGLFEVALRFAAPIYIPLVLSEIALGAVARTVPQINIFFVGMPVKIAVGMFTAMLVLPMLTMYFRSTVEKLIQDIWRILFLMA